MDFLSQSPPIAFVEALCVGGEREDSDLLQASKAAVRVRKLVFMEGNRLRGLGRNSGRKCVKWKNGALEIVLFIWVACNSTYF